MSIIIGIEIDAGHVQQLIPITNFSLMHKTFLCRRIKVKRFSASIHRNFKPNQLSTFFANQIVSIPLSVLPANIIENM